MFIIDFESISWISGSTVCPWWPHGSQGLIPAPHAMLWAAAVADALRSLAFCHPWHPAGALLSVARQLEDHCTDRKWKIPSGYVKIAIENHHL